MKIGVGVPKGSENVGTSFLISLLKADTWLSSKPDGTVGDRIVNEWSWEDNGLVLRLRLRRDVYFHDGTQLTPDVAVESLRATARRDNNSSLKSILSIETAGEDSVVLRLKEHVAFLLPDLATTVAVKAGSPDVGTGPYRVVSQNAQKTTLTAFPEYYHGRPSLAGVEVLTYPTQRYAWAALMRGDIDMLYEASRDSAEFVQAETTIHSYSFLRPYYIPIVFNMRHPVLRNVEVRRAINEALDRDALVRDGMRGQGIPADGPIFPQHWTYSQQQPLRFDPDSARKRLDGAGYPLKDDALRRVPMRFSFKCLVFGDDSRYERLSVIAQKQLADIGIDMQLEPMKLDELGPRIRKGDFDAFLIEMSGPRLSRVYDFWRSGERSMINSGYHAADGVLDRLRVAQNEEDSRAAVAELLRIMHDDPPAAFLAWQKASRAVSARFDVAAEPERDILTKLWMWRPVDSPQQAAR
jgi:peptide/nickel transport system substrate-binding protein